MKTTKCHGHLIHKIFVMLLGSLVNSLVFAYTKIPLNEVTITARGESQLIHQLDGPLKCKSGWFDFNLDVKRLSEPKPSNDRTSNYDSLVEVRDGKHPHWSWEFSGDGGQQTFFRIFPLVKLLQPYPSNRYNHAEIHIHNLQYNYDFTNEPCSSKTSGLFTAITEGIQQSYGAEFLARRGRLSYRLEVPKNYTDPSCYQFQFQDANGQTEQLLANHETEISVTFPFSIVFQRLCYSSRLASPQDPKNDFSLEMDLKEIH